MLDKKKYEMEALVFIILIIGIGSVIIIYLDSKHIRSLKTEIEKLRALAKIYEPIRQQKELLKLKGKEKQSEPSPEPQQEVSQIPKNTHKKKKSSRGQK